MRVEEAFDLLDALNTGHAGSISTVHANSALQALSRLTTLMLRADIEIPYRAIQREIGALINLVIHIERKDARRQVTQALRVLGFNANPAAMKRSRSIPKGSALARVQAVSPGFLAEACSALLPVRFAARMGDPPRLDSATPDLAGQSEVAFCNLKLLFRKGTNPYEHQARHSLRLYR